MRTSQMISRAIAGLAIAAASVSCVDTDWDLRRIDTDDMQISFSSVSAPFLKSEKMTINDLLNVEDNPYITTDEKGEYLMRIPVSRTNVDFILEEFEIQPRMYTTTVKNIPSDSYDTYVDMSHKFEVRTSDIPEEVTGITEIDLSGTIRPTFGFSDNSNIRKITMKSGSRIHFPVWVKIGDYDKSMLSLGKNNVFTTIRDIEISQSGISTVIGINGIDLSKAGKAGGFKSGEVSLSGEFMTEGHFVLEEKDIINRNAETAYNATFRCDMSKMPVTGGLVNIEPKLQLNNTRLNSTNLDRIMEIEGNYNLDNVYVNISIENNTPISGNFTAELSGSSSNGIATSYIKGLAIDAGEKKDFVLCDKESTFVQGITELINSKPDHIQFENAAISTDGKPCRIRTGERYSFYIDYSVEAPLAFKEGLSAFSSKTYDIGLDFGNVSIESLEFSFKAENTIPLGMAVSAAISQDETTRSAGNPKVRMNSSIVPGSTDSPTESEITLIVYPEKGKRLDQLGLVFSIFNDDPHAAIPLNESQTLSMKDIKVKANGITIDL